MSDKPFNVHRMFQVEVATTVDIVTGGSLHPATRSPEDINRHVAKIALSRAIRKCESDERAAIAEYARGLWQGMMENICQRLEKASRVEKQLKKLDEHADAALARVKEAQAAFVRLRQRTVQRAPSGMETVLDELKAELRQAAGVVQAAQAQYKQAADAAGEIRLLTGLPGFAGDLRKLAFGTNTNGIVNPMPGLSDFLRPAPKPETRGGEGNTILSSGVPGSPHLPTPEPSGQQQKSVMSGKAAGGK